MSVVFEDVTYIYDKGTPMEKTAVKGVSLSIGRGEFLAVMGRPGSGKSTFLHLLGGLLKPTYGRVNYSPSTHSDEADKTGASVWTKTLNDVGVVFQFPERQFFEDTVYSDLSFPLIWRGISERETDDRVRDALSNVSMDFHTCRDRSPWELSSGEKRKVAIAAILVLNPKVIALDDPFAGLDPKGKKEILQNLKRLQQEAGKTVVMTTKELEAASKVCDRFILLDNGILVEDGSADLMEYKVPSMSPIPSLTMTLRAKGLDLGDGVLDAEEAFLRIRRRVEYKAAC